MTYDGKMMRLCGADWKCCDGKCSSCDLLKYTTSTTSDSLLDINLPATTSTTQLLKNVGGHNK